MIEKLSSEMMRLDLCKETKGCGLPVSDGKEARADAYPGGARS